MKNLSYKISLLAVLFLSLTSCGSILKDRSDFTVASSEKNSTIYLDDKKVNSKEDVDPSEYKGSIAAKLEAKGYKDEHDAIIKNRNSIGYLLSYLTYVFWLDGNPVQYDKYYQINPRHKSNYRDSLERYINIDKVSINIKGEDFESQRMSYPKYLNDMKDGALTPKKSVYSNFSRISNDISYPNSVYSELIREQLVDLGYIDTTGSFLNSSYNTIDIEADLSKVHLYIVNVNSIEYFIVAETDLEWKVKDRIDNELLKVKTSSTSGKFLFTYKFVSNDIRYILQAANVKSRDVNLAIENSIRDAIICSIYDFLDSKDLKKVLNEKLEKEIIENQIIAAPTRIVSSLEEAVEASVTVKLEKGHGSGFFINNEGYLLTNEHVVSEEKNVKVRYKGKEYPAEVISVAKLADLALLKIDLKNEIAFELPTTRTVKIGSDVFAIGTPKSIDLSATLSKGIVSGFRASNENHTLIQSDASVNFGNSGGPFVDKDGKLIGIVNSKLAGFGIEGISFGLVGEEIMTNINLTVKK